MIIGICRNCKGTGDLWYGTGMCVGCSFEALERENRNLKETLTEALNDDNYGDHSSGIWQTKAKTLLKNKGIKSEVNRCPDCGYTEHDKRIHLDHALCPSEKKRKI